MRLDKFIANNSVHTRSGTRKLVKQSRVTVNERVVCSSTEQVDSDKDNIAIDGKRIEQIGNHYVMLNKPNGYVCANTDSEHPTVFDLFHNKPATRNTLHVAGRLDIDTTGLVLITNDGDWSHKVTTPGTPLKKQYHVKLATPLSEDAVAQFTQGLLLRGEKKPTRPAQLTLLAPKEALVYLNEGKYHQVKRMFAAIGNHVTALQRHAIGKIELDPSLAPGQYRELTTDEVNSVYI